MENWSSVIYKYRDGRISREQAIKETNMRIKQSTPTSIGMKRLRGFLRELNKPTAMQRFLGKIVIKADGCWEWTGGKNQKGYGHFWYDGVMVKAHRFIYESYNGEISQGLQIDHLCRNHACVNPIHLEVVDAAENIKRGLTGIINKIKTRCPKNHPYDETNTYHRIDLDGISHRHCRACRIKIKAEGR